MDVIGETETVHYAVHDCQIMLPALETPKIPVVKLFASNSLPVEPPVIPVGVKVIRPGLFYGEWQGNEQF
jgi:hypothetical protein